MANVWCLWTTSVHDLPHCPKQRGRFVGSGMSRGLRIPAIRRFVFNEHTIRSTGTNWVSGLLMFTALTTLLSWW